MRMLSITTKKEEISSKEKQKVRTEKNVRAFCFFVLMAYFHFACFVIRCNKMDKNMRFFNKFWHQNC